MKRLIAAVSLAALASSAFALEIGKPYEQLAIDRALPNIPQNPRMLAAAGGDTRSDAAIAAQQSREAWAEDHNFVAPAQ